MTNKISKEEMAKLLEHYPRPRMCPEKKCYPLFQIPTPPKDQVDSGVKDDPPGESWHCFGCLGEKIDFEYEGEKHENDLRSCCYTPLKGLIAWHENREDWEAMERAYMMALRRIDMIRIGMEE